MADIVLELNPQFLYPRSLASNLFEMANNQIYFAKHLPRLTDVSVQHGNFDEVVEMLNYFAFNLLKK